MQKSKNLNESVDDRAEYGKLVKLGLVFLSRFLACRKNIQEILTLMHIINKPKWV